MSRGGKRLGAGRPEGSSQYGEATKTIRVPISRVEEIKDYLQEQSRGIPLWGLKSNGTKTYAKEFQYFQPAY